MTKEGQAFAENQNLDLDCQLPNEVMLLIAQQVRQHIQLLTQMALLSSKDVQWQVLNTHCRDMLNQIDRKVNEKQKKYVAEYVISWISTIFEARYFNLIF